MDNFYKDLQTGKRGERLVKTALEARNHTVIDLSDDREAQRKDIDLLLVNPQQQRTTLEIKNDVRSESTGNVFIETYNIRNKSHSLQGWLFYCAAEFMCFLQETSKRAHIVALSDIKEAIKTNKYKEVSTATTKGILIPVAEIEAMPSYFCLLV